MESQQQKMMQTEKEMQIALQQEKTAHEEDVEKFIAERVSMFTFQLFRNKDDVRVQTYLTYLPVCSETTYICVIAKMVKSDEFLVIFLIFLFRPTCLFSWQQYLELT